MSLPRTFRVRVPPKTEPVQPFLTESPPSVSVNRVGGHKPTNSELVRRSEEYQRELPTLMSDSLLSIREFVLSEVVPPGLALYNGAEDAREVAFAALESDPQLSALMNSADSYLQFGLKLKMLRKISGLLSLSTQEAALLYTRALGNELNLSDLNSLQGLVTQVAKLAEEKPTEPEPPRPRVAARRAVRRKPRNARQ